LIPGDDQYPGLLAATSDPPLGLFVRGRLDDRPAVAIVGSRKATPYGLQVARLLGEELGNAGVVVVSGMARGVDEAAHRGTLAAGGRSWAVWGTGPDRIYPPEHGKLAEELAARGALITEYPPGTPPRRHHFPERNRILSGLVQAVVVVEAAARSGALITARLAMEEGREVLAVPGNIFSELSVGPNTLLRVGARPLLTPRDLFDAIGCQPPAATEPFPDQGLLRVIGAGEALTADEIAARTESAVGEVLGDLLALELAGEISRLFDGRYSRVRAPREKTAGSEE
jgi:DNA processing protein